MHSLRRAALRSAISASRAVASKPQPTTSFAAQWSRSADVSSVMMRASSRWFSQTARVASDAEDAADKKAIDEAIRSASEVGSVNSVGEPSSGEEHQSFDAAPAAHDTSNPVLTEGRAQGRDSSAETPYGLFIRNMVFEANEHHLKDAFEKYGEVAHASIARDGRGLSKGFGFVWFKEEEAMKKAAAESDGSFWHGRRIQVAEKLASRRAGGGPGGGPGRRANNPPSRSIYVGNIPYETTDAELNKLFRELDNVTDVRIAVDRTTGWPRGFAHADFTDTEAATKAIKYLESITFGGRKLRLDFSSATKRDRNQIADTPPEFTV